MVVKTVAGQYLVDHKGLRGRHQVGVAGVFFGLRLGHLRRLCAVLLPFQGVRPVLGHGAGLARALQHGYRVLHVLVEHRVVLDHGANARVPGHRRTQRAQAVAALAAQIEQAQRQRRLQQTLQTGSGQTRPLRQLVQAARLLGHRLQDAQAHAGQQHLRIDKTGHQVKHLAHAAARHPPCQGIGHAPAVQGGAGHPAVQ